MFRSIFNRFSRRLNSKFPGFNKPQYGRNVTNVTSESKLLESPQLESKVDFTLKELILHDIDKRRNDIIEHRITQTENKFLFIAIGATLSIIGTVIGTNLKNETESNKNITYVRMLETDEKVTDVRTSEKKEGDKKK